jgi:hypothetical protein
MLLFLLSGCVAHRAPTRVEHVPQGYTQRAETLAPFSAVVINAPVHVNLHNTSSSRSGVVLHGYANDLAQFHVRSEQGVLFINFGRAHVGKQYHLRGDVTVDISMQVLRRFTYKGKGIVTGHHIQTSDLDMHIQNPEKTSFDGQLHLHHLTVIGPGYTEMDGISGSDVNITLRKNPKVQLTGMAKLASLDINGKAIFSFYWVKSDTLRLRARGNPRIQLAGTAERLDVELWGNTQFHGRYLRARRVFAKTHDHAIAEIATLSRQHTLALDASDIYFYNLPTMRTDFMAKNGAVLDMRDWELAMEQEYTRYNK